MEACMQDLAEVFDVEALLGRRVADPDPGDIALANVLDARGPVDEVMDLTFEHRLEVLLHLAPGDLDDDPQVHRALIRHVVEGGSDKLDLAVLDLVQVGHEQVLEGPAVLATELDPHVGLTHDLAFKGGAVRHGHGDFGDTHFHAAYLDAFLHQPLSPLQIIGALDFIEGHRHDVFVLELMNDAPTVDVPGKEGQDVASLQLAHDLDGDLVALGAADDCREAGHAAIDQLD